MKPFPLETAAWIRDNAWTDLERTLYDSGLDWVYSKCMCEILGDCLPCKRGDHAHCESHPRGAGHRGWVRPPEQGDLLELLGVKG